MSGFIFRFDTGIPLIDSLRTPTNGCSQLNKGDAEIHHLVTAFALVRNGWSSTDAVFNGTCEIIGRGHASITGQWMFR
jgi:hypothetical protein